MLTADKNVLPDPGRGADACHAPFTNCAVLQVCRLASSCIEESGAENWAPLIVTVESVKLTVLIVPENLGLKTALSQTTSPGGTDWLLNCVEKHTPVAHGVEVGEVHVVVVVICMRVLVLYTVVGIALVTVLVIMIEVVVVVVVVVVELQKVGGTVIVVFSVTVAGTVMEMVVGVQVVGVIVVGVVVLEIKQEQADEMLDEALVHWSATSEGVGPYPEVIRYELQKAELAAGV
jgi:hypothetical protein